MLDIITGQPVKREDIESDIAKMTAIAERLETSGWTRIASRIRREIRRRKGMLADVGSVAVARIEDRMRERE